MPRVNVLNLCCVFLWGERLHFCPKRVLTASRRGWISSVLCSKAQWPTAVVLSFDSPKKLKNFIFPSLPPERPFPTSQEVPEIFLWSLVPGSPRCLGSLHVFAYSLPTSHFSPLHTFISQQFAISGAMGQGRKRRALQEAGWMAVQPQIGNPDPRGIVYKCRESQLSGRKIQAPFQCMMTIRKVIQGKIW